jgi:putative hemolysin
MIILLFFSALLSGSEIAFFSLSPTQIHELKNSKSKKNKNILQLLGRPKHLLASILIAINFINISIVIISSYIIAHSFDFTDMPVIGFIIQVIIVTFLILFFGEIMPKVYATHHTLKFARLIVRPMQIITKIVNPLSTLLVSSTSIIEKRITRKGHDISMNELSQVLEMTSKENTEEETNILKGIVKFGNIDVKEIMKSRMDIIAVSIDFSLSELLNIIDESGYSRIPVYKDNFDSIVGILYVKDLLPHFEKKDYNWQSLVRPPFFVPESKKINDLLEEFQHKKIHVAIVVDEYGGTSGIVSLEDIIEEIVGEITDEFDSEDLPYSKLDDKNYVFEAKTSLNDFCKILGKDNSIFAEVKGDSDTLAGLLLELKGEIPEKNSSIVYKNFTFKVESADKRRIKRIKVSITNE